MERNKRSDPYPDQAGGENQLRPDSKITTYLAKLLPNTYAHGQKCKVPVVIPDDCGINLANRLILGYEVFSVYRVLDGILNSGWCLFFLSFWFLFVMLISS